MSIQERVRQLPTPTDDTSQEFEAYKNRMGYDAAKMKSIRYKMSVYDEFLEELEARKKYHGIGKHMQTEHKGSVIEGKVKIIFDDRTISAIIKSADMVQNISDSARKFPILQ